MKLKEILSSIAVIAILTLALITAGCDEGVNMAGDVLTGGSGAVVDDSQSNNPEAGNGSGETPGASTDTSEETVMTMGEMKKPDPEQPSTETTITPPKKNTDPITHRYLNGIAVADVLPSSAWVLSFPGPYVKHTPPQSSPTDFVGRVCMSVAGADSSNWAADDYTAPISGAVVTITHGPRKGEQALTNEGGYYLFKDVTGNELHLRVERQWLEPKEVTVHRLNPTALQQVGSNRVIDTLYQSREGLANAPGTILMGIEWPDAIRFVLEEETLPHDLLCIVTLRHQFTAGSYGNGEVTVYNAPEDKGDLYYHVLTHELAHARQHAVAISHGGSTVHDWKNTSEAKAYAQAWEKDLKEAPGKLYLTDDSEHFSTLLENAAEFCSTYWMLEVGLDIYFDGDAIQGLQTRAPNRFKWAQANLNKRYAVDVFDNPPTVTKPDLTDTTDITLVEGGVEYTYTVGHLTYPGYNPPPTLQRVLDTHPSTQLPNFEAAVKMTEVIKWVNRVRVEVYPDNPQKWISIREEVQKHFGLTKILYDSLSSRYSAFFGVSPSLDLEYWFLVECLRLLVTYDLQDIVPETNREGHDRLIKHFKASLENGYIIDEPDPHSARARLVEVGSEYTFTVGHLTYPGYNPPPALQRVLDTHPSAKLPHFKEAVKMTEVVDWVYLVAWDVYPDPEDDELFAAATRGVDEQFGLDRSMYLTLSSMYIEHIGGLKNLETRYWWKVECLRLLIAHPHLRLIDGRKSSYNQLLAELQQHFAASLRNGHIVDGPNPWYE